MRRAIVAIRTGLQVLIVSVSIVAQSVHANPASDRAFSDCATAAAAYLGIRGHQIGAITLMARDAHQHKLHITSATFNAEPAAIICSSSRGSTAIEVISIRQLAGGNFNSTGYFDSTGKAASRHAFMPPSSAIAR